MSKTHIQRNNMTSEQRTMCRARWHGELSALRDQLATIAGRMAEISHELEQDEESQRYSAGVFEVGSLVNDAATQIDQYTLAHFDDGMIFKGPQLPAPIETGDSDFPF